MNDKEAEIGGAVLAANIKAIRKKLGLNQTKFGEMFELSQSWVSKVERGETVQPRNLKRDCADGRYDCRRITGREREHP